MAGWLSRRRSENLVDRMCGQIGWPRSYDAENNDLMLADARADVISHRLYTQAPDLIKANGESEAYELRMPRLIKNWNNYKDDMSHYPGSRLFQSGFSHEMQAQIMQMAALEIRLFFEHVETLFEDVLSGDGNSRSERVHCFAEAMYDTQEDIRKIDAAIAALRPQLRRGRNTRPGR